MALGGETPADKAGIRIEGEDRLLTLIQNQVRNVQSSDINLTADLTVSYVCMMLWERVCFSSSRH